MDLLTAIYQMNFLTKILIFTVILLLALNLVAEEKIKVGFPAPLSGDAETLGIPIINAAIIANELIANNKFEFIFEDSKCQGAPAVSAANKLINVDRVKYAIGMACNSELLASAEVYGKAGVTVLTTSANSGDQTITSKNIFRIFPADQIAIDILFPYIQSNFQKIGVITEEDAYSELLTRAVNYQNKESKNPLQINFQTAKFQEEDFRPILLRLKQQNVEAVFINTATEPSFIRAVQQTKQIRLEAKILGVYMPFGESAQQILGKDLIGVVGADLPDLDANPVASKLMKRFAERFGKSVSALPLTPTFEAVRILNQHILTDRTIPELVKDPEFIKNSLIGPYKLDDNGAIQGIHFVLKTYDQKLMEQQLPDAIKANRN